MSTLTLRHVAIDTYKENVAYLHRECKLYHSEGFQALNKIEIHTLDGDVSIIAVLNVVDDVCITTPDELGLCEQAFEQLGVPGTSPPQISLSPETQAWQGFRGCLTFQFSWSHRSAGLKSPPY